MTSKKAKQGPLSHHTEEKGITRITVGGFKSITTEQSIDIKPLTILAGANSSGKSSMMQPLLLLKQTLEAPYDPGALLLDGPNVNFSQAEQLLAHGIDGHVADTFSVGIVLNEDSRVVTFLRKGEEGIFEVEKTIYKFFFGEYCIRLDMLSEELNKEILSYNERVALSSSDKLQKELAILISAIIRDQQPFILSQQRSFLDYTSKSDQTREHQYTSSSYLLKNITNSLHQMLHLPGFRGNPQRTYPLIPLGPNFTNFSGTFENYTASVISYWQKNKMQKTLHQLNQDLARLGLTNKVMARQVTSAHVELLVNRFLHNCDGAEDMVNIADVGFGVSQALPVVVALHIAEPGQLVYIEQPELHLHPRAQHTLAEILADAALAGKRVVIETHSDLVLSGIQTLVAEGTLPPELVKLHWFEQLSDGSTKITSADLDTAGAFGEWPEDFHTVILNAENRYLNAAEARLMGE